MEIQKIYSDVNTDEKLYSVLMNEDELTLFSEIQKEFNSKAAKERNYRWLHRTSRGRMNEDRFRGEIELVREDSSIKRDLKKAQQEQIEKMTNSALNKKRIKERYDGLMSASKKAREFDKVNKFVEDKWSNDKILDRVKKAETGYDNRKKNFDHAKNGKAFNRRIDRTFEQDIMQAKSGFGGPGQVAAAREIRDNIDFMKGEMDKIKKSNELENKLAQIRENRKLTNKIKRGFKGIISKIK